MRNGFNFLNNYYDIAKTLSAKNRLIFYDLIMELNFSCFKTETELEQFCSKIESELEQNQKVLVAFLGVKFHLKDQLQKAQKKIHHIYKKENKQLHLKGELNGK